MKYFIIAGEKSGDLHGSNLIKEIKNKDNDAEFRFFGGNLMQNQDKNLLMHYNDLDIMGVKAVILNIKKIFLNIKFCKEEILKFSPDVLLLIDYPGFNLRIAKFEKKKNFKVFYFISPQIWAWKKSRIKIIKKYIHKLFVILPFEKDFYKKHNYEVEYVGHPLSHLIENYPKKNYIDFCTENKLSNKKIIALLPGSRASEIKNILPLILSITDNFPDYHFVVAATTSRNKEIYYDYFEEKENVSIVFDQTYELLQNSYAAIVASGTATLETGLFEIPFIVCYRIDNLSYNIIKRIIKIKYISLVNLILNKLVAKELIQGDFNSENLIVELDKIINNNNYRDNFLNELKKIKTVLKSDENSYKKTVNIIINDFDSKQ